MTDVKICGISTPEAMTAAIEGGARFVGLVFHDKSPRYVSLEVAAYLAGFTPSDVHVVGLFVDPDDRVLETALNAARLDMLQLHGSESPGRVAEIKKRFGVPVMKAISVGGPADLEKVPGYEAAADWLLFDTKSAAKPGGTGQSFDWTLLQDFCSKRPWMLAGGLNAGNVRAALALEPDALDVSSGVESVPGLKDPEKIREFLLKVADGD